jgi:hypothetical protein
MEQQYRHRSRKQSPGQKKPPPKRADEPQQAGQRMDDSPQHAPESGEPTETGRVRVEDSDAARERKR